MIELIKLPPFLNTNINITSETEEIKKIIFEFSIKN